MNALQNLIDVATGKTMHLFDGPCPDHVEGWDSRDDECPACRVIVAAERQQTQPPAPAVTPLEPLHLTEAGAASFHAAMQDQHVPASLPTREQIAEAIRYVYDVEIAKVTTPGKPYPADYRAADAVLALLSRPTPTAEEAECGARHPHFPAVTSSCTQPLGHDGPHASVDGYIQWPEEGDRG
ncbi:hypothetical protein [Curtobacterium sp. UCD-KPL2560]|uniref:hypothetical protein n=1 Tax=Curtobacterium sp. UCD-KPL2560 TaxID=1885315 RepID=UPI000825EAAA|nr:hypothetical protein [Curtobacterium sp. UCD-KPL2560]